MVLSIIVALAALAAASPSSVKPRSDAFKLNARQASMNSAAVEVDLGYSVYGGCRSFNERIHQGED